jgi:fructokinase
MTETSAPPGIVGIELGGTKSIVVLARGPTILARQTFPTTTPNETFDAIRAVINAWLETYRVSAVGIASFGPIRIDEQASDYGTMLATPKAGWSGAVVAQRLMHGLDLPWAIDTDVNAAALAELQWGAGQGLASLCYLTIGTGLGGGLVVNGRPIHGALHPEIGHLKLRRQTGDSFDGICPFHGDCAEGLLSGPAIEARFGRPGQHVDSNDPRWQFVAADLAELIATITLLASPQRILIGGGVGLGQPALINAAMGNVLLILNGYLPHITQESIATYIMAPALGADAGPLGAVALGETAVGCRHRREQQRPSI